MVIQIGSNPIENYLAPSPNGKAQDFDSCIYWFDPSRGCLMKSSSVGESSGLINRVSRVRVSPLQFKADFESLK